MLGYQEDIVGCAILFIFITFLKSLTFPEGPKVGSSGDLPVVWYT